MAQPRRPGRAFVGDRVSTGSGPIAHKWPDVAGRDLLRDRLRTPRGIYPQPIPTLTPLLGALIRCVCPSA